MEGDDSSVRPPRHWVPRLALFLGMLSLACAGGKCFLPHLAFVFLSSDRKRHASTVVRKIRLNKAIGDDNSAKGWESGRKTINEVQSLVRSWDGPVFAIGDLHGDLENTAVLLMKAGLMDQSGNWQANDSLLVQTGDIADRGPDPLPLYALFQRLTTQAPLSGGRVVQLLGNHECLLLCGMYHYLHPTEVNKHYKGSLQLLAHEWSPLGALGRHMRDSFHVRLVVNNVAYVHAGILPQHAMLTHEEMHTQLWDHIDNRKCGAAVSGSPDILSDTGPMWTRALVELPEHQACSLLRKALKRLGAKRMVVGHTPTPSKSIETRCDGRLVMIDTGLSRYLYNRPSMLEINNGTYSEHFFGKDKSHTSRVLFNETSDTEDTGWFQAEEMQVEVLPDARNTIIPVGAPLPAPNTDQPSDPNSGSAQEEL
eukprot:GHVN01034314.1.p1 GENE.GHVN01034314.1~~GHVN01034314.1.p1  ORF type:complete len:424 (+),score=36.26 GHVN01034314.1:1305-2576(+)